MKFIALSIVAVGLAFAALPVATAQDACQTSFTLVGKDDSKWYLEGGDTANPRLTACPDSSVTFTITVPDDASLPHNFLVQADGAPPVSDIVEPGDSLTYTWDTPASGSFTYICQLHGATMSGTVEVAQQSTGGGDTGGGNDSPGLGVLGLGLAALAAVLLARRK